MNRVWLAVVFAAAFALWITACESESAPQGMGDAATDASPADAWVDGGCPWYLSYVEPGCGAEAKPLCNPPVMDAGAVLIYYCGCEGKTIGGGWGGVVGQPFAAYGCCDGESGLGPFNASMCVDGSLVPIVQDAGATDADD